jgi:hypothetical protein
MPKSAVTGISRYFRIRVVAIASTLVFGAAAALAGTAEPATAAPAISIGTCEINDPYHLYAHQYSSDRVAGEYGQFITYNVTVPDISNEFSLSHLYIDVNTSNGNDINPFDGNYFIEVGYYKGEGGGSSKKNVSTPHYYRTFTDSSGYHEGDDSDFPDIGSTRLYELLYIGHNDNLGTDDWQYYYENLTTPRDTVHMNGFAWGHPLAGGELDSEPGNVTQMEAHGVPSFELESRSSVWSNWTSSDTGTAACAATGMTFRVISAYQEFTATGSK